jgi:hypothetical protein
MVTTRGGLNANNTRSLAVLAAAARTGVRNAGYWGIAARAGASFKLSFFARSATPGQGVVVRLVPPGAPASAGAALGAVAVGGLGVGWARYEAVLTANASHPRAELVVLAARPVRPSTS